LIVIYLQKFPRFFDLTQVPSPPMGAYLRSGKNAVPEGALVPRPLPGKDYFVILWRDRTFFQQPGADADLDDAVRAALTGLIQSAA